MIAAGRSYVLWSGFALSGLVAMPAFAMQPGQLQTLPAAPLLDKRVDAVFKQCGLPAAIDDSAAPDTKRQALHWEATPMQLSAQPWTLHYSRVPVANAAAAWRHPQSGSADCLAGLAQLVITTKGEAGFLTVKKRPDNNGYITTYTVPDDLFNAHQVIGIHGHWLQDKTAAEIRASFGEPDEILDITEGSRYRYWIVQRDNTMPMSAQAVEFDISGPGKTCRTFAVYTSGTGFVQEKLDALIEQWQRVFVLD